MYIVGEDVMLGSQLGNPVGSQVIRSDGVATITGGFVLVDVDGVVTFIEIGEGSIKVEFSTVGASVGTDRSSSSEAAEGPDDCPAPLPTKTPMTTANITTSAAKIVNIT